MSRRGSRPPVLLVGALLVLVGCSVPVAGQPSSVVAQPSSVPVTTPPWTPVPAPTTQPDVPAVVSLPAPTGPARELSSREWALIAKSPDSHVGEHVVVFGYVSQFDSVTGPAAFRASLDGVRHRQTYEYDTNAILVGRSVDQLANVVVNDMFRAEVTITGSYSYRTTMGGTLTVPQMQVEKIEVTG
jgi:hypothetical protein